MARGREAESGGHRRTRFDFRATHCHHRAHRSRSDAARPPDCGVSPRRGVVTPARQAGYRLLGPRFDYLLHTRPAEWPIVAAHAAVGYLLAVGLHRATLGERLAAALLGIGLWVIGLNGGTLALNSAVDRDEGDVAYLHRPPQPPPHLAAFGVGLMVAGLAGSLALPVGYR